MHHCQPSKQGGTFVIAHSATLHSPSDAGPDAYLPSEVLNECMGAPIYRVRITGPEIFNAKTTTPNIHDGASLLFHAEYKLDTGGTFHAEILQLYSNFSFCDHPGLNRDMVVARHTWDVDANSSIPCQTSSCPLCLRGSPTGRWIANSSSRDVVRLLQELEQTHIFHDLIDIGNASHVAASIKLSSTDLRWQPSASCSFEPTQQAINTCKCNSQVQV